ncbi:uncharacterized protein N7496_010571 [Penicillium cataractarum]|uniref:Uncharacterized protein n=1 Tax=Penicillium cataractarum TaxID=2100454 RepID=A0A9W9RW14_9EURO|nr:uncharacterized protein N7496_010571 [Penicillium cataractarum]KAJ5364858.1 hypothetical protein N7496_010571 [Penicillium cataractarum]
MTEVMMPGALPPKEPPNPGDGDRVDLPLGEEDEGQAEEARMQDFEAGQAHQAPERRRRQSQRDKRRHRQALEEQHFEAMTQEAVSLLLSFNFLLVAVFANLCSIQR